MISRSSQDGSSDGFKQKTRSIVNGSLFESFTQGLVLLSLLTFTIETIPSIENQYEQVLNWIEGIVIGLFTSEYLLRLWTAEKRLRFVFSFFGIIDLLTILPALLTLGVDGRPLRAFRLIRVFRIFKLVRYSDAIERIQIAWRVAKEELTFAITGSLIVIYVSSVFIYFFERTAQPDAFGSVPDALWWAVVTFTTVGYGDLTPITLGGKLFSFVLLMTALVMVGIPAGIVASALTTAREIQLERKSVTNNDQGGG